LTIPLGSPGTAAGHDPVVFRALLDTVLYLALPQEVLQHPGMKDRIDNLADGAPLRVLGPDYNELLRLLSG
jgi:hypothetical protein